MALKSGIKNLRHFKNPYRGDVVNQKWAQS